MVRSLIVSLFCFTLSGAHAGINFERISIDEALEKAKVQKKLVFVDTYASWCAPCKVMDKVFAKNNVGQYFNSDFINVKIDMDGMQGPVMQNRYGVVWLPTMMILDETGGVLMKLDKVVTPAELIGYAKEARAANTALDRRGLSSNPFPSRSTANQKQDYNPIEKEEVIYVYDERESSGRPHIMYHEAYLHLQLRDGKHKRVVDKYLSTQKDWSTEKNVKFIFDFLEDVNSDMFDYFIANRWRFEEVMGKEKVHENIGHLINQRIEQGYPRPSLDEYVRLYKYLDQNSGEELAYKRYLSRMVESGEQLPFINAATTYIKEVNPFDHNIMYQLSTIRNSRSDSNSFLNDNINLMTEAAILDPENHLYQSFLSRLLLEKGEKSKAIEYLQMAILNSPESTKATYQTQLDKLLGF